MTAFPRIIYFLDHVYEEDDVVSKNNTFSWTISRSKGVIYLN